MKKPKPSRNFRFTRSEKLAALIVVATVAYVISLFAYNHFTPVATGTFKIKSKWQVAAGTEKLGNVKTVGHRGQTTGTYSYHHPEHFHFTIDLDGEVQEIHIPFEQRSLLKSEELTITYRRLRNGEFRVLEMKPALSEK